MRHLLSLPLVALALTLKLVAEGVLATAHVLAFWAMKLMEFAIYTSLGKEHLEKAREMADKAGL